MDEMGQMKDSFGGVLVYQKNYNALHYFRRLSFWGTIMLLVNIAAFDLNFDMLTGGPYSNDALLSCYHGFLLWALIALVSFVLSVIFWAVYMPHYGEGVYSIFQYIGKLFVSDGTVPFRIIKSIFEREHKDIIGFITMGTFIGVNIIAILKSI